jgi:hypothetical protein
MHGIGTPEKDLTADLTGNARTASATRHANNRRHATCFVSY